ncbi:MAG: LysR family transcriptional regulator [Bosea sp.]|jgi:LysR family nitrogen assimilation transcriptional regulator|uniref:LysR family transcriptional regulator n=1 Tax=Hyphomicrobiales TaxID=356 RepID=UPI00083169E0|nr:MULTISPECIES: LysR family transcriptional regulator [Hyphomicrobiales]MCP4561865.1 LysR family transcriptional regulator [Bosea sp. (in: a-proteobacteria)]MCP4738174.1 LysR family transcriptional regulator [Bosea sp. (in: a-proteobacteria)]MDX3804870.1 LysR family transcriptional regulator [Bosea sp. (in: a-proteobacteria)]
MRFRQLECFERVCELGSITQAASTLNVAQTALGLQIRQLEDEMGCPLLSRTSRGVAPTDAGRIFLDWTRRTLDGRREIRSALAVFRDNAVRRTVTVGLTPSMTMLMGADLIQAIARSPLNVNLQLAEGLSHVMVAGLPNGKVDLAFAFKPEISGSYRCSPLLKDSLFLIRAPSDATRSEKSVSLRDALSGRFAMPDRDDVVRRMVEDSASAAGLSLNVAYEVHSLTAIKQLVSRGLASAILPLGSVYEDVAAERLTASRIPDAALERTLYAIRAYDMDPALDALLISTFLSIYRENASGWGMGEVLMLA